MSKVEQQSVTGDLPENEIRCLVCGCFVGQMQVSTFNDASTDDSLKLLMQWKEDFSKHGIEVIVTSKTGTPGGVGFAKNQAVVHSTGTFLCFLDADDVMLPGRVVLQLEAAQKKANTIIGCRIKRDPEGSTQRFTEWANTITSKQLYLQAYTSHGPTVLMPTWFMSRDTYNQVGQFDEAGKGTPEDLIFFYVHLRLGGKLHRVDDVLLMYRYHVNAATFSIHEDTIWDLRVKELEHCVLSKWSSFTIWNAGKQGRKLYRSLTQHNKNKVMAFCDVDAKKISKGFYTYEECKTIPRPQVPIVHFEESTPPYILCMKQNLTNGGFERNLSVLNIKEGDDYIHFN